MTAARQQVTRAGRVRAAALIAAAIGALGSAAAQPRPSGARPAASGPASASGPSESARKQEARMRFERGIELFGEQAYDAALAEFVRSRELYPTRAASQNAAAALRELHRYAEALAMLDALLREFPALAPADRADIERERGELRDRIGTLEITCDGADARVVVDGVDRGPVGGRLALDVAAGSHAVRVFREGYRPFEVRLSVAGRSRVLVEARLEALPCSLAVDPRPDGARVILDGVPVSDGGWQGRLACGEHRVDVEAAGFVAARRTVRLDPSRALELTVALEREVSPSPRLFFELDLGAGLGPSLGSDGGGSSSLVLGGLALGRAGYQLRSGLGLTLDVGYLGVRQSVRDRPAQLTPVSLPAHEGRLDETLWLRGALVGLSVEYMRGERWRLGGRLGLGALLGAVTDARTGTFETRAVGASAPVSYGVGSLVERASVRALTASPEVRLGLRLSPRWQLTAAAGALLLAGLPTPRWPSGRAVPAGQCTPPTDDLAVCAGRGFFPAAALLGGLVIVPSATLGLRYELR